MRSSQRSVQQRLGAYSRRRRLMLSSPLPETTPPASVLPASSTNVLDPQTLELVHTLAKYLNQRHGGVESLVEVASRFIRGQATGSAVLADFPEVECEIQPGEKRLPAPTIVDTGDPQSVFSDFGRTSETPLAAVQAASLDKRSASAADSPPNFHSPLSAETARNPQRFSSKPFGESPGMNRIRSWLHTETSRVWMFVGDETTASMRYQGQPGYAEMFRHRLRWELRRFSDVIVNAGLQEAGIGELQRIVQQGMAQCRPHVVFVMPGRADLPALKQPQLYGKQLVRLAELIREQGAEPVFQTPPVPHDLEQSTHALPLAQLADLVREICIVDEIPLIDHAEYWMDQASCRNWYRAGTEQLTSEGQAALTMQFFAELDLFDRQSPLCARLQLHSPPPQSARSSNQTSH